MIRYQELEHKMVRDTDGFYTDLTLYQQSDEGIITYIIILGDRDFYSPEDGEPYDYADTTHDDLTEAVDTFEYWGNDESEYQYTTEEYADVKAQWDAILA